MFEIHEKLHFIKKDHHIPRKSLSKKYVINLMRGIFKKIKKIFKIFSSLLLQQYNQNLSYVSENMRGTL